MSFSLIGSKWSKSMNLYMKIQTSFVGEIERLFFNLKLTELCENISLTHIKIENIHNLDNVYEIYKFFKERFRWGSAEVSRVYDTFIVQSARQKHFRESVTQSFFKVQSQGKSAGFSRVCDTIIFSKKHFAAVSGVYHKLRNIFVRFRKGLTRVSRPPV